VGSWKSHESSLPAIAGHRRNTGVSKVRVPRDRILIAEVRCYMDVDGEKLEHVVLALLHMNSFKEGAGRRAWKSLPWTILNSLYEKGYISDPVNKNKSVGLTDEGAKLSEELFEKLFAAT